MEWLMDVWNGYLDMFFYKNWASVPDYIMGSLIGLVVVITVFAIAYFTVSEILWLLGPYRYKYSKIKKEEGKVIALDFERSHTHTSVGPVVGGNGGVSVSTSYTPEEDNVIIKSKIFGRIIVNNLDLFNNVEPGDIVDINYVEKIKYNRHNSREKEVVVDHIAETVEFKNEEYEV